MAPRRRDETGQGRLFDGGDAAGPELGVPLPAEIDAAARALDGRVRLGTSSWTFPGWAGLVYASGVNQRRLLENVAGLRAYASQATHRTVGVDRTYYAPISEGEFAGLAGATPGDFRFLVKAHRDLLEPAGAGSGLSRAGVLGGAGSLFLNADYAIERVIGPAMAGLGPKLGPVLFQFSPMDERELELAGGGGRGADRAARLAERLQGFFARLPARRPDGGAMLYAVELRNSGCLTERYARMLGDASAEMAKRGGQGGGPALGGGVGCGQTPEMEFPAVVHAYNAHPSMPPIAVQARTVRPKEQGALVVRWMLRAGWEYEAAAERYAPFNAIVDADDPTLRQIAALCRLVMAPGDGADRGRAEAGDGESAFSTPRSATVIINNKAEGSAPMSVRRLLAELSRPGSVLAEPGDDPGRG